MRILHYSLGLPPYRTGGLTKFCIDLISKQKEQGHNVFLIWPGRISVLNRKVKIKKSNSEQNIENFEIINPLPISLNGGINRIEEYIAKCVNPEEYEKLFDSIKPDIIHIHTLMGLHKEMIEIAKSKGIKVVFTSHDYFGICPKVTMFRNGNVCQDVESYNNCEVCNQKALSRKKITLLQSPIYRKIKDLGITKKVRRTFRQKFFMENDMNLNKKIKEDRSGEYEKLRNYYMDILKLVDKFHFNSSLAKEVYEKYIKDIEVKGEVVNISHNHIEDNKKVKDFSEIKKLSYLSPDIESKGYKLLLSVLDELWESGERWFKLNLYTGNQVNRPYVINHSKYDYSEIEEVFNETDVLVAPSLWYETFGYTVLEALSFGVPVIITENVGAKDLLEKEDFGIIVKTEKESLKKAVLEIKNQEKLTEYNKNIVDRFNIDKIKDSYKNIQKLYENL